MTYGNVFEGLTLIDGEGQVVPRLASGWTVSADGLRYTFTLRSGVRFHDDKPFDAAVAAFSLQRLLQMRNTNAYLEWFDKLVSAEARDEYLLRIRRQKFAPPAHPVLADQHIVLHLIAFYRISKCQKTG